jgi:hypothetical protein
MPLGVEPGVHAGDDGDLAARRQREIAVVELRGVGLVVGYQLVGDAHPGSFSTWAVGKR